MITLSCENCDDSFDVYPSKSDKRFCSRQCWSDSSRRNKKCKHCNSEFWTYESQDKIFCSDECYRKSNRKETISVECGWCGRTFDKDKVQVNIYEKHYCDKSCAALDQPRTGTDFNYDLYGKGWVKNRKKALKRDSKECQICEDSENLHVHHIKGRKYFYDEERGTVSPEANELNNLVTLCIKHHNMLEGRFISKNVDKFVEKSKDLLL